MRNRIANAALMPVLGLLIAACTVQQTEEGEAPTVDPGETPAYEIQPADVDVGWDTTQVRVPDIDITPRRDTLRNDTTPAI